ncbi:hypothetical protein M408DRAFT_68408 [Serendipita vermifera MAFF 305830]|uniref:Late embryogenesis abundant protein LEA-2 subgroup domain-containing protein n=1 Tax=Serendipita vermifera MAFF 305830 TaxID=933852 RepID=A0A0C2WSF3_SERVB|nr:hypothetical protein M408DRAFT_68408 [Serendipita vermifera MAFF 305830]
MAYQDPYSQNYNYNNGSGYSAPQHNYNTQPAQYPPYDPAGGYETPHNYSSSYSSNVDKRNTRASFAPPKDTGDLRLWRHDEHGNLWTKGGRGSCIGRFCCCSIMSVVFAILAVAFSIAMWLRPPDVSFGSIGPPTTGSALEATASSFKINLALPISVKNPNFFAASFEKISADIYYPVGNVVMGGGAKDNIVFASNSQTTFNFPVSIDYTAAKDPNSAILTDIADRCGFSTNAKRQIQVKYVITLQIKILAFSITPSFSGQAGFDCPLSRSDIQPFLGNSLGGGS